MELASTQSNIFDKNPILINNDNSRIYGLFATDLVNLEILNWKKNRPPDMTRIPEIIEILKTQNYLDGFIYLFKEDNKYYCYDGIHRVKALEQYYKIEQHKRSCHRLFVHLYNEYDEYTIEKHFKQINKCIPVPEIYTDAAYTLEFKEKVEYIVNTTYKKYPKHFSTSKRPNKVHENRDIMIDKVTSLLQENKLDRMYSKEILFDICIIQFNGLMKKYIDHAKLTEKQKQKCETTGCYIFIDKNWDRLLSKSYVLGKINIV